MSKPSRMSHNIKGQPFALFLVSILCLTISMANFARVFSTPLKDDECVNVLFPSSPANDAIEYHWENYNNILHPQDVYRGPPTPDRVGRWNNLTKYGVIRVGEVSTKIDSEKRRDAGNLALVGTVLHMSCMKLLWRSIYNETDPDISATPAREQIDGCIEILREHLMCTLDPTMYLLVNSHGPHGGVRPVIGNMHYCRDYASVSSWSEQRFIDRDGDVFQSLAFGY